MRIRIAMCRSYHVNPLSWYTDVMAICDRGDALRTDDFMYDLPPELIAQEPLPERDASRLLVLDRQTAAITHDVSRNLGAHLGPGDLLVLNASRVRPARVWAVKPSGGRLELLILRPTADDTWEALVKPGRRAPIGTTTRLDECLPCIVRRGPQNE